MHYNHVLLDLLIIFVSALGMMLVFFRVGRLPTVLAFLAAGVACGPHGFGFVTDAHTIEEHAIGEREHDDKTHKQGGGRH